MLIHFKSYEGNFPFRKFNDGNSGAIVGVILS